MKNKTLLFSFLFLSSVAIANQVVQQSNALNLSGINKNATGTQNGQSTYALDVNVINPTTAPVLVGGSILANQGNAGLSSWPVNVSQVGGSSVMMGQQIAGSSIPVVIASDQSPIPVTGSFSIPGVATAANQATETTALQAIQINTGISTVNSTGSNVTGVVSSLITLSPPLGAVGFILMNRDTSSSNIDWAIGTSTVTTASGQQLQPGRSSDYVPVNSAISLISESGIQDYSIQWIIK